MIQFIFCHWFMILAWSAQDINWSKEKKIRIHIELTKCKTAQCRDANLKKMKSKRLPFLHQWRYLFLTSKTEQNIDFRQFILKNASSKSKFPLKLGKIKVKTRMLSASFYIQEIWCSGDQEIRLVPGILLDNARRRVGIDASSQYNARDINVLWRWLISGWKIVN